jgi:hypothetical protein
MNLTILYTANIRGDLALLPPLYTFLKSLVHDLARFAPADEDDVLVCAVQPPPPTQTLLLDLGDSCAPDVWHCAATGGRSTLIALDAMGYHAANVSNILDEVGRDKLADNPMGVALVDERHPHQDGGIRFSCIPDSATPFDQFERGGVNYDLQIVLAPAESTRLAGKTLYLAGVEKGHVGTAHISMGAYPHLLANAIFDLPPNTPPDPTIAGTVDFITNEAHFYARKQSR